MPWTNQGGNGGTPPGGRGPWGGGSSGGGGGGAPRPPDFEELLRRGQDRIRRMLPRGNFGSGGVLVIVLAVIAVWLMSGIYDVSPSEQGVVLRFGKFIARTGPGINYHLPWPIDVVYTPNVTQQREIDIGYRQASEDNAASEDVEEESLMLTGDENIVDINFTVYWVIKDAAQYLFDVEDPPSTVKAVAESAMREVVGENQIEPILTQDRGPVQDQVRELMQKTLDSYGAGVTVTSIQMQKADPPAQVIDAYRDVQAALTDQQRMRNEAEAYANKIIPEARGNASRIVQQAEAYKQQAIAEASGEAKGFLSVLEQYRKAPDVTRRRMYLETMSGVLGNMNKVIVDDNGKVLPYLPLPALKFNDSGTAAAAAPNTGADSGTAAASPTQPGSGP